MNWLTSWFCVGRRFKLGILTEQNSLQANGEVLCIWHSTILKKLKHYTIVQILHIYYESYLTSSTTLIMCHRSERVRWVYRCLKQHFSYVKACRLTRRVLVTNLENTLSILWFAPTTKVSGTPHQGKQLLTCDTSDDWATYDAQSIWKIFLISHGFS